MKELINRGRRIMGTNRLFSKACDALRKRMVKYYRKASILPKPQFINISPTNRCNLSCMMCEIWSTHKRDTRREMTTDEIKLTIRNLHRWLGPFTLNFAGGEPFVRPDMIDLIKYASGLGITVYSTSNGMLLTPDRCRKLVDSGIAGISISLDSMNPKIHNKIRNSPIAFEKTMQAIKNLNELRKQDGGNGKKMDLTISTVFMGYNRESILPILDFVEKEGLTGINYQPLMHTFGKEYKRGWHEASELWPKPEQVEQMAKIADELVARKKSGSPIHNHARHLEMMKKYFSDPNQHAKDACNVGYKNFSITEYGEVLICYFFKPIGNILETSPEELWRSLQADKTRKRIAACKRNCDLLNCNFD